MRHAYERELESFAHKLAHARSLFSRSVLLTLIRTAHRSFPLQPSLLRCLFVSQSCLLSSLPASSLSLSPLLKQYNCDGHPNATRNAQLCMDLLVYSCMPVFVAQQWTRKRIYDPYLLCPHIWTSTGATNTKAPVCRPSLPTPSIQIWSCSSWIILLMSTNQHFYSRIKQREETNNLYHLIV